MNLSSAFKKHLWWWASEIIVFLQYLTTKVKLIETTAPSIERAFQLFEILNNRGQSLEPLDLLKNHLLKNLTSAPGITQNQIKDFSDSWSQFLKNLKIQENQGRLKHLLLLNILLLAQKLLYKEEGYI